MLIAQITDLHILPPGRLAYGRVDTAKALERCVAVLNEFRPAPDFVVISGDLADTPTSEEYDYLKRLLAPLKLPFAGIPGNHDSRELMRAAFPQADYAIASGPLNQRGRFAQKSSNSMRKPLVTACASRHLPRAAADIASHEWGGRNSWQTPRAPAKRRHPVSG